MLARPEDEVPVEERKRRLRKRMRPLRLVAEQKEGPDAALAVIRHCLPACDDLGLVAGAVAAGYWPILTEIDVRPLLARLADRGLVCALPAIVAGDDVLHFRRWAPTDDVVPGDLGTSEPPPAAERVTPDVVFAPLLAVDPRGNRLGQGLGWYDRTIAALRRQRPVVVVGLGFGVQRIAAVPTAPGDEPVDWILTERGLDRVRR